MNPGINKPVTFTFGDAERIGMVVKKSERERRGRKPSSLPRAAGSGGGSISTATFSGQWLKTSQKIVNLGGGATANCTNLLMDLLAYSGSRKCIVAEVLDGYTLVNAECG